MGVDKGDRRWTKRRRSCDEKNLELPDKVVTVPYLCAGSCGYLNKQRAARRGAGTLCKGS